MNKIENQHYYSRVAEPTYKGKAVKHLKSSRKTNTK